MKVVKLGGVNTPGNASPAVYETDRGTLVVQGYRVQASMVEGVERFDPSREELIEVPIELLALVSRPGR